MYNTLTEDRGQHLFQTSTHTAHHWRPGYYFPSPNFKSVINNPLPGSLTAEDKVRPEIRFETTTGTFHDNKYPFHDELNDPLPLKQVKPLPCYKVNYMYDVVEKLNAKPRRPLSMAFQKSEYKEEYEPRPSELVYELDRPIRPKLYLYDDEVNEKLTEKAYDGEVQPNFPARRPIDPSQVGVFNLLDPYMTTYNKDHKKWKKDELKNLGPDAITIHKKEKYGDSTLLPENKPMRDEIWFKSETKHRNVHCPPKAVPHSGTTTEFRDMFKAPSDVKAKEAKLCPVDTPFTLPTQSADSVFATQEMYKTEYTNIGRGKIPMNQYK